MNNIQTCKSTRKFATGEIENIITVRDTVIELFRLYKKQENYRQMRKMK